ncbi:MAG: hypothetical protein LUI60_06215 [Clostridia bacterium]|nr:hypothetical protein [Clostridia bacterium]
MDKIKQLQERKEKIMLAGKSVREDINALIDENSFVELSTFSFSRNEFYGEDAQGEGVVTGFATIDGFPYYIAAINPQVMQGGVSDAMCDKIFKCLDSAEKNDAPVIYILSTKGVQIGEGVSVLEGLSRLILKAVQLKGSVTQYAIINGEVYGQLAAIAAACDFTFFVKDKGVLAANSPLVISAKSGVNLPAKEVGGAAALNKANIASFVAENIVEVKGTISKITELLAIKVADSDEMNTVLAQLNEQVTAENLMNVFDENTAIETGACYSPEVKCVLGRIGGISAAAVIFDKEGGVMLDACKARKIKDFAEFACCNGLPFVTFVDCIGICPCLENNNSLVLKEITELVNVLDCLDSKVAVVSGKAVGIGYTLFAAKNMGYDCTFAFANAQIALFDGAQGAEIEYSGDKSADKAKLAERYAEENSDPVNAAKNGYIDNIIEPAFVKQYLAASLQMLLK